MTIVITATVAVVFAITLWHGRPYSNLSPSDVPDTLVDLWVDPNASEENIISDLGTLHIADLHGAAPGVWVFYGVGSADSIKQRLASIPEIACVKTTELAIPQE